VQGLLIAGMNALQPFRNRHGRVGMLLPVDEAVDGFSATLKVSR
jgi:hypothetical protein